MRNTEDGTATQVPMRTDLAVEQLGGPNFSGVFVGEHLNGTATGFIKFFGNREVTEV